MYVCNILAFDEFKLFDVDSICNENWNSKWSNKIYWAALKFSIESGMNKVVPLVYDYTQ